MTVPETSAATCHGGGGGRPAVAGAPLVAFVGSPNVGKSTLFNALTGASRDMGNWPGTSVEVGRGAWAVPAGSRSGAGSADLDVLDLPGAYSLDPVSPDEALTRELLVDDGSGRRPDAVVVAVDAGRLSRSLYLVTQVQELGLRLVVALTMNDVARAHGVDVDTPALAVALGVPVVAVDARRRQGFGALAAAVLAVLADPAPAPVRNEAADELDRADARFARIATVVAASTRADGGGAPTWSDRLDRIALAPVLGPLVFLAVMWTVFQLTTTVAAPLQGLLDAFFTGPVTSAATALLGTVGLADTWVRGLVVDGLIAGVGMLLTFVPLMAIMFLLLALLEDSGYLARAAVVTDRVMRALGLPGRAFLPLVVGFGCNVPAIAATRVLPNARHRVLTALLVPFTSCSARLTVYVLVASVFFPEHAGSVVFAMYLASLAFVVVVGLALRSTLWRSMGSEPLILDLPPYQRPAPRLVAGVTWMRLRGFLRTASGIIVATVIAVWFLQAVPASGSGAFGEVPVQDSAYARIAATVAPVFQPAGFGDWQATSALMVGFVAKEAVISSWSQTYATAEPASPADAGDLGAAIRADFTQSSGGHPDAAAWAFLLFLLAYTPCVATLAAQRREIGLRWTVFGVTVQLVVAWIVAVSVFQVVSRLG